MLAIVKPEEIPIKLPFDKIYRNPTIKINFFDFNYWLNDKITCKPVFPDILLRDMKMSKLNMDNIDCDNYEIISFDINLTSEIKEPETQKLKDLHNKYPDKYEQETSENKITKDRILFKYLSADDFSNIDKKLGENMSDLIIANLIKYNISYEFQHSTIYKKIYYSVPIIKSIPKPFEASFCVNNYPHIKFRIIRYGNLLLTIISSLSDCEYNYIGVINVIDTDYNLIFNSKNKYYAYILINNLFNQEKFVLRGFVEDNCQMSYDKIDGFVMSFRDEAEQLLISLTKMKKDINFTILSIDTKLTAITCIKENNDILMAYIEQNKTDSRLPDVDFKILMLPKDQDGFTTQYKYVKIPTSEDSVNVANEEIRYGDELIYEKKGDEVSVNMLTEDKKINHSEIIGWKTAALPSGEYCIVKLLIPGDAEIVAPVYNDSTNPYLKYRCSKAYVIGLYKLSIDEEKLDEQIAYSWVYKGKRAVYKIGQLVFPDMFDRDTNRTCTGGIHFHTDRMLAFSWIDEYAQIVKDYINKNPQIIPIESFVKLEHKPEELFKNVPEELKQKLKQKNIKKSKENIGKKMAEKFKAFKKKFKSD